MRRRNGNGSQQLQDVTEKFRKGEAKLIRVLEEAGYLTERERSSFLEKIDKAVAQKRSSEVLATANTLHNKIIRVLQSTKGDSRPREGQELELLMEVSRLIQSTNQREEALDKLNSGMQAGNLMKRNISKTPEMKSDKAKIEILPVYVPAMTSGLR